MQNKEQLLKTIRQWMQGGKGIKWAVILGVLGMLLILLSEWWPAKGAPSEPAAAKTVDDYRLAMESDLQQLLQSMEGVGTCRVYVTLESGVEYVYAKEQRENSDYKEDKVAEGEKVSKSADTQENIILIDGSDGKTGLLLTEIQPQVKGVVVVCSGADTAAVSERVTQAVVTALNISSRRVCVTK